MAGVIQYPQPRSRTSRLSAIRWNSDETFHGTSSSRSRATATRSSLMHRHDRRTTQKNTPRSRSRSSRVTRALGIKSSEPPSPPSSFVEVPNSESATRGARRGSHWSSSAPQTARRSVLLHKRLCGRCTATSSVVIVLPGGFSWSSSDWRRRFCQPVLRTNFPQRIPYDSTFHMAPNNLPYYVEDLA